MHNQSDQLAFSHVKLTKILHEQVFEAMTAHPGNDQVQRPAALLLKGEHLLDTEFVNSNRDVADQEDALDRDEQAAAFAPASGSAKTTNEPDEEEEDEGEAGTFKGRLSPFAKGIDPDLEPEAFRAALRDNIYNFQGKSLGNQHVESYMASLIPAEGAGKEGRAAAAKTAPKRKKQYDLFARSGEDNPRTGAGRSIRV
jgi:hypothetical protein